MGIYDPTISPDGAAVYLPGYDGQTLGIYRRETEPTSIAIAPLAGQPPADQPPPASFSGHLPALGWLPRGRITVTAVATAARHHSAARRLSFVISG